ncbi:MAG: hypothetical protein ABIP55_04265, partial [Tepidisphaeraceae bacterium]
HAPSLIARRRSDNDGCTGAVVSVGPAAKTHALAPHTHVPAAKTYVPGVSPREPYDEARPA